MERHIQHQNLTYILSNKEGRILWNGIKMNPYTFTETFILGGGQVIFEQKDVPKSGFEFNEKITEEMNEEAINIHYNPLAQINLRRQGLEIPEAIIPYMYCYQCEETREIGYFCWLLDDNLKNLNKAGIDYRVL